MQVLLQFDRLYDLLEGVQLSAQPDTFTWRFTAVLLHSICIWCHVHRIVIASAKHIWKTSAPPKVKFFFWLVMHGRCWTADRRFRHGLQDSNACIFCDQGAETMNHILLGCPFSREVWEAWLRKLHLQYIVVVQDEPAIPWWLRSRKALPKQLRSGFDSLFFLIGWSIWKERNAKTFDGVSTLAARLEVSIQEEADAWCMAGYKHLGAVDFLCALNYTAEQMRRFVPDFVNCTGTLAGGPAGLNYPSFVVAFDSRTDVRTLTRTLTKVSEEAAETYNVTVVAPQHVKVTVTPTTLEFKEHMDTRSYSGEFRNEAGGNREAGGWGFGQISWANGKHEVKSPVAFQWNN
jgi:hypothetical protein